MRFKLFIVEGGWKVGLKSGEKMKNGRKFASNKPLSKERAMKQLQALEIAESGRSVKGAPSKTHKGDKDYTTKRGDKDFHRKKHDVKKSRKPYTK